MSTSGVTGETPPYLSRQGDTMVLTSLDGQPFELELAFKNFVSGDNITLQSLGLRYTGLPGEVFGSTDKSQYAPVGATIPDYSTDFVQYNPDSQQSFVPTIQCEGFLFSGATITGTIVVRIKR